MDRRDQSQSTAGASAGASGLVLTNGSNAGFVFRVGILVPDQMVEEMVEFHWIRAVSYTHLTLPTKVVV